MKDIIIEIIKILKIPLIIITLIFSWPDSLKLSEIIAYIDELKYDKDGNLVMKFKKIKNKMYKLEEQIKELKYNDKNVEKILEQIGEMIIDLEALDNLSKSIDKSSIIIPNSIWQVKLDKEDIDDIFGSDKIIEHKVYRVKKPFKVFEYSQYVCLANPIEFTVKSGEIVKILKIEEKDRELYVVLKILN